MPEYILDHHNEGERRRLALSSRARFDLVTARAVLHHVADADTAVANLVASARPGGAVLIVEPDFLPVSIAEPAEVLAFWGRLAGLVARARD